MEFASLGLTKPGRGSVLRTTQGFHTHRAVVLTWHIPGGFQAEHERT